MKKTLTISIIAVIFFAIAFLGAIVVLRIDEDTWICDGNQWIKHGHPESPIPTEVCGEIPQQAPSEIKENNNDNENGTGQVLGGDKDEHGCIGSAGYTWCSEKNKCLRIWEEDCPSIPKVENN
jgi:hypothetical protein